MQTYTIGTKVFCDYHFGGKPQGKVVRVIAPGDGRGQVKGEIEVQLTETIRAYRKGEIVTLPAWQAVPAEQERSLRPGEFFRRVSTDYCYV